MNNKLSNFKYPLILDGGLSNVLEDFGCDLNHKLWVAKLLSTNPEAIIKTHLAYLEAGAQVISTSSYQATIPGFINLGFSEKESEHLILKSVELAQIALERFIEKNHAKARPLIAASIGPYGAYLADGSEYKGNYNVSDKTLVEFHQKRLELLDNSSADLIAFETIPSYQELNIIASLLQSTKTPAWISFSCKDDLHINDGTAIKKCVALLEAHSNVFAVGINCTQPKYISGLIENIHPIMGSKKIIIYPNSGEVYHPKTKTWFGISDPNLYTEMVKEWIDLGADIVGGCCRIGPNHIENIQHLKGVS